MSTLIAYLNRRNLLNAGWIFAAALWLAATLGATAWVAAYETSDVLGRMAVVIPLAGAAAIWLVSPVVAAASWRQNTEPLLPDLTHRSVSPGTISFASLASAWIAALLILVVSLPASIWALVAGDGNEWASVAMAYGAAAMGAVFAVSLGQLIGALSRSIITAATLAPVVALLVLVLEPLVSLVPIEPFRRFALLATSALNPVAVAGGLLPDASDALTRFLQEGLGTNPTGSVIGLAGQAIVAVCAFAIIAAHSRAPRRRVPARRRLG